MSGEDCFSDKELAVLAKLRSHVMEAAGKLSTAEREHLPKDAAWIAAIEANDHATWGSMARNLRRAAGTFQIDGEVCQTFQTTLLHLINPLHARLMLDNQIRVFDEAPDDLVFPQSQAEAYEQALEKLKQQVAALVAENGGKDAQITQLQEALRREQETVAELIKRGSGWQIKLLSGNKISVGDISLGGEWWEPFIAWVLKHTSPKGLKDDLIAALAKGRKFALALADWSERHAVAGIERGARERIEDFHKAEARLALPAPQQADAASPIDFSYVETYNRLLRGETIPASWIPQITLLDFDFSDPHHLLESARSQITGDPKLFSNTGLLAALTNLTVLKLDDTQVKDISPLAALTKLTVLSLVKTQVKDVSPLAALTNLTSLLLVKTQVKDVSPLADLTNLTDLSLDYTQVKDVSPLAKLTNLTNLWLSNTQVKDVSPLVKLTNLTNLSLNKTRVKDISPLAHLTKLTIHGFKKQS